MSGTDILSRVGVATTWVSSMKGALTAVLAGCLAIGCDDGSAAREKAEQEKAASSRREESRAKQEAEVRLMTNLSAAEAAIGKRLYDWITVKEGLFLLRGHQSTSSRAVTKSREPWFSMPAGTTWFVSCDDSGVRVTLGPWLDVGGSGDNVSADSLFGLEISDARLSEEQCKELVVIVGRRMREITARR
jgi:hypothetical protein